MGGEALLYGFQQSPSLHIKRPKTGHDLGKQTAKVSSELGNKAG